MKKFIISILCVAVFFIGLGGLIQETGARFKSDERSLSLIRQAQIAIGGETAVRNVRSLSIVGQVTKSFDFDGTSRTERRCRWHPARSGARCARSGGGRARSRPRRRP